MASRAMVQSEAMALTRTDDDLVEIVVREHARLVYRIAHCVLRNAEDAEDATQETFLRVLRYRNRLVNIGNMKAWVARIAWRTAAGRRKARREVPLEGGPAVAAGLRSRGPSAEENVQMEQRAALIGKLIAALPDELRDAVTLSALQEMVPADVAQVLGCSEAAVRSRVFRARQILKGKLASLLDGRHGI